MLHNRTRHSRSIPRRLLSDRRPHLLPLYWLLRLSDLAREGMEHSGSYRFADHIYSGSVGGRGLMGRSVDRILLSLPSSRSFRNRFVHAREGVLQAIRSSNSDRIDVLSVPSGIARELIEAAVELRRRDPQLLERVMFHCLDLDRVPLEETRTAVRREGLSNFHFHHGDALDPSAYPNPVDVITSTGLAEFLTEDAVVEFYQLCFRSLKPGGVLISSATVEHRLSSFLLEQLAELTARYRNEHDVQRIFSLIPIADARWVRDEVGYQILIEARKKSHA